MTDILEQRTKHIKGMSESNLYLFKQFYLSYPQIFQSLTKKLYLTEFQSIAILRSVTTKFEDTEDLAIEEELRKIIEEEQQKMNSNC